MSPELAFKVAILVPGEDSKAIAVRYRSIPCFSSSETSSDSIATFDELPQSYIVAGKRDDGAKKKVCLDPPSKALGLSYTATYDASCFLSDQSPRGKGKNKSRNTRKEVFEGASISTGQAALILSRDNSSDSTFRSPQYHTVTFSFPHANDSSIQDAAERETYQQLLMIRQPGLQRSGPMSLTKDLGCFDDFDTVEVCTGMCLFSEQDLAYCTNNGAISSARLKNLPVSLSEMEIMTRLSTTIANTASLYHYNCVTRHGKLLRVNIDIPSVQYYQNALESYSNGQCTAADVLDWMVALQTRRRHLFGAFVGAIRYGLQERGVPESSVAFELSTGLDGASEGIYCALKFSHNIRDWMDLIIQSAITDGKELWPEFMSTLTEKEQRPSSWRELNTLSYMYEVVKPVLRARSIHLSRAEHDDEVTSADPWRHAPFKTAVSAPHSPKIPCTTPTDFFETGTKLKVPNQRVLLLAIDDVDECRIYTKAYQSLCRLSTASARSPGASLTHGPPVTTRILTICPAPQVVVGTSGTDPKWTRPSLWRSLLRTGPDYDQIQFQNEKNVIKSDVDMLKEVYDPNLVKQIAASVRQEN